jgi:ATP/maltotriose-dependent transcriptional regulator MalT
MVVSAPTGSGKTVLLWSWIGAAGLAGRAAWVPVARDERDPQRFWLAVLDALHLVPCRPLCQGGQEPAAPRHPRQ